LRVFGGREEGRERERDGKKDQAGAGDDVRFWSLTLDSFVEGLPEGRGFF